MSRQCENSAKNPFFFGEKFVVSAKSPTFASAFAPQRVGAFAGDEIFERNYIDREVVVQEAAGIPLAPFARLRPAGRVEKTNRQARPDLFCGCAL